MQYLYNKIKEIKTILEKCNKDINNTKIINEDIKNKNIVENITLETNLDENDNEPVIVDKKRIKKDILNKDNIIYI